MTRAQVIKILTEHNIHFIDKPEAMLDAFYKEMRDRQFGAGPTIDAFLWFADGWDAAAARLR